MRASNSGPDAPNVSRMTEQESAHAALDALRARSAGGERIGQSAIAEAIRRAAESDLAAQHSKHWPAAN
jgi:hypothetical protein